MKRILTALAATLALAAVPGCGPNAAPEADAAAPAAAAGGVRTVAPEAVGPNTYSIAAHGMTITAPEGWYVADTALMEKLMAVGKDVTTSNMDSSTKAAIDNSLSRAGSLFTFMEVPPGTPRDYIPAIMGVSEDVSMMPGLSRGSDYHFHARKLMEQSPIPTTIAETYTERMIGGQSFDRMDIRMGPPGKEILQRMYAARHGNQVVAIIQSYKTDEELAALDKVLDSIKLDW
jgi:hypothetical protein